MLNVRAVGDQGGAYNSTRNIRIGRCRNGMMEVENGNGDRNASARSGESEHNKEADELLECTVNMCGSERGINVILFQTLVYWKRSCLPTKVDSMG
jgi:hypothetical protein